MNIRQTIIVAFLVSVFCVSFGRNSANAQIEAGQRGDARVRKLLEQIGWTYIVDSDGDFKLVFKLEDGRSQIAYVISRSQEFNGLEVREIWAPAIRVDGDFDETLACQLLEENCRVKIGAWRLAKTPNGYLAIFSAQISVDADAHTLATVVKAVSVTADKKEHEVTGRDDL